MLIFCILLLSCSNDKDDEITGGELPKPNYRASQVTYYHYSDSITYESKTEFSYSGDRLIEMLSYNKQGEEWMVNSKINLTYEHDWVYHHFHSIVENTWVEQDFNLQYYIVNDKILEYILNVSNGSMTKHIYTYSGYNLIRVEYFEGEILTWRNEYIIEGKKVVESRHFLKKRDEVLSLMSKEEYNYSDGNLVEIKQNYKRDEDSGGLTKKLYKYSGDKLVAWEYYYTSSIDSSDWKLGNYDHFNYNINGLLESIERYDSNNFRNFKQSFTYESGTGNLNLFWYPYPWDLTENMPSPI